MIPLSFGAFRVVGNRKRLRQPLLCYSNMEFIASMSG